MAEGPIHVSMNLATRVNLVLANVILSYSNNNKLKPECIFLCECWSGIIWSCCFFFADKAKKLLLATSSRLLSDWKQPLACTFTMQATHPRCNKIEDLHLSYSNYLDEFWWRSHLCIMMEMMLIWLATRVGVYCKRIQIIHFLGFIIINIIILLANYTCIMIPGHSHLWPKTLVWPHRPCTLTIH